MHLHCYIMYDAIPHTQTNKGRMSEVEEQQHCCCKRCCYCNYRIFGGDLLCSTEPHTSDGYVDFWTWMHAAYGGFLFLFFSPFKYECPDTILYWLPIILLLAILWELIERHRCFPESWQRVEMCFFSIFRKCNYSERPELHRFDKTINSVSDVLATCLTYSLSWTMWLLRDTMCTECINYLLVASPAFCVIMAIVQAACCSQCPGEGKEVKDCCSLRYSVPCMASASCSCIQSRAWEL